MHDNRWPAVHGCFVRETCHGSDTSERKTKPASRTGMPAAGRQRRRQEGQTRPQAGLTAGSEVDLQKPVKPPAAPHGRLRRVRHRYHGLQRQLRDAASAFSRCLQKRGCTAQRSIIGIGNNLDRTGFEAVAPFNRLMTCRRHDHADGHRCRVFLPATAAREPSLAKYYHVAQNEAGLPVARYVQSRKPRAGKRVPVTHVRQPSLAQTRPGRHVVNRAFVESDTCTPHLRRRAAPGSVYAALTHRHRCPPALSDQICFG